MRIKGVKGVTFARINGRSVLLTDCSRTNWAHSKVSVNFRMTASSGIVRGLQRVRGRHGRREGRHQRPAGLRRRNQLEDHGLGVGGMLLRAGVPARRGIRPHRHAPDVRERRLPRSHHPGLDALRRPEQRAAARRAEARGSRAGHAVPHARSLHRHRPGRSRSRRGTRCRRARTHRSSDRRSTAAASPDQLFAKDSYVFGSMYNTKWGSRPEQLHGLQQGARRTTRRSRAPGSYDPR